MSVARDHYASLAAVLQAGPPPELDEAAALLHDVVVNGGTIYTFGNGACAALASHMATDFGKGLDGRVRIVSLVDNAALLTAYANDRDYECVFEEQLRVLIRAEDVAIGLSGSGSSPNVLRALELARSRGARTIGLTGAMDETARLAATCDVVLRAPLDVMEQIEDMHVVFAHVLMRLLRERLDA